MKVAVKWGLIFGLLQGIISIIVSIRFTAPEVAILACSGLLLSFILTFVCSLLGTIETRNFIPGFLAGMIATGIDLLAAIAGYVINPATLSVGIATTIFSWVFTIVSSLVVSSAGAGVGVLIHKARTKQQGT